MKLKLVMSNAETGEVLREETNLNFAMMCFGRKTDAGMAFSAITRGESLSSLDFASCLNGVDRAVEKNLIDNKSVGVAYALVKLRSMGEVIDMDAAEKSENADCKKEEVEQA